MVIPPPGGKARGPAGRRMRREVRKSSLPEPHPERQGSLTARRQGTLSSSSSSSSSIPQAAGWTIPEAAELGTDSSIPQTAGWPHGPEAAPSGAGTRLSLWRGAALTPAPCPQRLASGRARSVQPDALRAAAIRPGRNASGRVAQRPFMQASSLFISAY